MQSLCHASNHDDDVPMFHNLSSLKIYGVLWFKYAWHAVRLLLFRAPKLQTLTFELVDMYGSCCSDLDNCSKNSQDVPQCLSLLMYIMLWALGPITLLVLHFTCTAHLYLLYKALMYIFSLRNTIQIFQYF